MARNRPGKRERQNARRQAIAKARYEAIERNLAEPKPEPLSPYTRHAGPKGFRASIAHRDNLRSHSHDIGFVGPRGFKTPTDMVGRNETVNERRKEVSLGLLASPYRSKAERERALELASLVRIKD